MNVKITGIQLKIFCCTGSGCCGFSCICTHIVDAHDQRPHADVQELRRG